MKQPYRTLFYCELEQRSGLNAGGSGNADNIMDAPLCRDGKGRLTLRGQGLAGALISTARKIFGDVPSYISALETMDTERSRWRIHASHLPEDTPTELRQHNGIRQDTGAAAEGVLYDTEIVPRGHAWQFLLEVNTAGNLKEAKNAERIAAACLLEWSQGRCWIGGDIARGLGWMVATKISAKQLSADHFGKWPRAEESDKPLKKRFDNVGAPITRVANFLEVFGLDRAYPNAWSYVYLGGQIRVGQNSNGYGWDGLHVGGLSRVENQVADSKLWRPSGVSAVTYMKSVDPDHSFAMTKPAGAKVAEPLIPGSGLRGPLRHAASRLLRQDGLKNIADPLIEEPMDDDPLARLFGKIDRSAMLLVCDAWSIDDDWQSAWLQHHAADEFAGSIYRVGQI